jgi:hypothetical protein
MKRILICLISAASFGCTTAVPVVKRAPKCNVTAEQLTACGDPALIKQGVTFGELVDLSRLDRETLRQCALKQKSLASLVAACNALIDSYNAEIKE